MREIVLAVLLIGAAFLGGAFVSGPGLRWVQACALQSLGSNDGLEIAAVYLESTSSGETTTQQFEPPRLRSDLPLKPITPARAKPLEDRLTRIDAPIASSTRTFREALLQNCLNSKKGAPSALLSATINWLVTKSSSGGLVLAGAEFTPPITDPNNGDFQRRASNSQLSRSVQPDSQSIHLPSGRSSNEVGQSVLTYDAPRPMLTKPSDASWALLESRMRAMGVTRFRIEGTPTRHIRCTCLIPLPGQQAISQWFEAAAGDISQTTRDVLCHMALWRASQMSCAAEVFTRNR